ncbi:MAG: lipoate--protein ligase [Oscillospiraceae bacterium]|nr:lipoate--protein ligase [Oscillospiraceae bacterium]
MIQELLIYNHTTFDPHYNIALEKYLLEQVKPGQCILYLWQNKNTVVIGRNQNAWVECRTGLLEEEGGILARRLSGGGAVFHDLGNLNFTFLVRDEDYDVDRQLSVIQTALRDFGILAEKSGRNDLLADGRKFSGNAFFHSQGHAYHHGTLLVDVDKDKLQRYLTPPKAKLEAKGIQSVRSRVVNLKELAPELTCDILRIHMCSAFSRVYGLPVKDFILPEEARQQILKSKQSLGSWDWCYGQRLPFSFACEGRFPWGSIRLELQVESGAIRNVRTYSDSMDWEVSDLLNQALQNCRFDTDAMCQNLIQVLGQEDPVCADLCGLIRQQQL